MSQIQSTTDITGALSQTDLNAQDIQNIIDEFNKFQDQYTSGNIQQNQQNIIVFDNQTNRVLIGYQSVLQQWGLFVSQIGVDVTEATADQMIFNSNQNILKIVNTVTGSYTMTATDVSNAYANVSFPHGLDFKPTVEGSFTNTTDSVSRQLHYDYYTPVQSYFHTFTPSASVYIYSIDLTDINIGIKIMDAFGLSWLAANSVLSFNFYCLQQTIAS